MSNVLAEVVKRGLEQCVANRRCQFMTYGDFGRLFRLGDNERVWANHVVLDQVADLCLNDSALGLDLTYLLRNKEEHYPSVVGGKPFDRRNPGPQILKAREKAQEIINRFAPRTPNPY